MQSVLEEATGSPWGHGRITIESKGNKGKKGNIIRLAEEPNLERSHVVVAIVLVASQTGFVQKKFIRDSAVTMNGENFSVHNHQRPLIL